MSGRDGGPAFPIIDGIEEGDYGRKHVFGREGLSLRDWFAGQALAGVIASHPEAHVGYADAAIDAYNYADAMLAVRRKAVDE